MKPILKLLPLWFLLLLQAGCSTAPTKPTDSAPAAEDKSGIRQKQAKSALTCWEIKGKLGYIPYDPTLPEGGSANLFWRQQGSQYQLELSGPLGHGKTQLQGIVDGEVTLITPKGEQIHDASARNLMMTSMGWAFPIDAFIWWIRGLPNPDSLDKPYFLLNNDGQITSLRQGEWLLDYLQFQSIDALTLPKKLRAIHRRLKIKMSVNNWSLNQCQTQ